MLRISFQPLALLCLSCCTMLSIRDSTPFYCIPYFSPSICCLTTRPVLSLWICLQYPKILVKRIASSKIPFCFCSYITYISSIGEELLRDSRELVVLNSLHLLFFISHSPKWPEQCIPLAFTRQVKSGLGKML